MVMPRGMRELIDRVCAANPRTVVVLQGGAPMEMPWRDRPAAILLMYLSGCQGGGAAVDVLVGDVNPSGKLAETWPVDLAQTALGATYPDMDNEVLYREGPFVGYRYYDAVGVEPAFPFGHGMSYTEFAYQGLVVEVRTGTSTLAAGPPADADVSRGTPGGGAAPRQVDSCAQPDDRHFEIEVSFTLRNVGSRTGAEVAQVYIAPASGVVPPPCPVQWLARFAKIELEPGEERRIALRLDEAAFRKWDASLHRWRVYPGEYEIRVASSSRDIRLMMSIAVGDGQSAFNPEQARPRCSITEGQRVSDQASAPAPQVPEIYRHPTPGCFAQPESARAFAELYARPLPERPPVTPFTIDSTVSDMGACWLGRRPGCFAQPESARAFAELYARPLPERPPVTPFTIDSTVSDMGACWLGRRLYRIIDWVMAEPASKMNRRPLPERPPVTPFTIDSTVSDMGACWLGRRLYRIIDWVMAEPASKMNRDQKAMMQEMAADMPLRSLTTSGVPLESVKGFVSMLNGHYLTGFIYAVRNLFRK